MTTQFPGWIAASDAVEKYGISYTLLRKLVSDGVLTRGVFSTAKERPPIYLRTTELDAWKSGGVGAVAPVRSAFEASQREVAAVHTAVVGGEV